jgi:hypothetical protein
VYVSADLPHTHATRIAGAVLLLPVGAVIAGTSAAAVFGVPFGDDDRPVEVRTRTRRAWLRHGVTGPGCRAAMRALRLCDPRAESPPESILRVHLHLAGLPVVAQHWRDCANSIRPGGTSIT